jgi:hypothetical protein
MNNHERWTWESDMEFIIEYFEIIHLFSISESWGSQNGCYWIIDIIDIIHIVSIKFNQLYEHRIGSNQISEQNLKWTCINDL